ncbi:MAG: DUF4136 domain-containing protein [Terriglobales bacterium]
MKKGRQWFLVFLLLILASSGFAQKIKVGYDKSADFAKYKTYSWAEPAMPVTRPLLYQSVVGTIDDELKSKGLQRTDKGGDLTLIAAGGIGFGYNMPPAFEMNAAYWSGEEDTAILTAPLAAEGTLILEFVDRGQNKMVWRGTARENLDPEMAKALPHIEKAIVKLLKEYPPKHSSK